MNNSLSFCKGDICLHAKGELAENIMKATAFALLLYGVSRLLR